MAFMLCIKQSVLSMALFPHSLDRIKKPTTIPPQWASSYLVVMKLSAPESSSYRDAHRLRGKA